MGNLFSGLSVDWGFKASDIFSNGMFIVAAVATFILIRLAIDYVPVLIEMIYGAATYKKVYGKGYGKDFFKELKIQKAEQDELRGRRGRR